jgi:hypothetical protein
MVEIVRPFAQRVADDAVGLVLADLGTQRAQHRQDHLGLQLDLVEQGKAGIGHRETSRSARV